MSRLFDLICEHLKTNGRPVYSVALATDGNVESATITPGNRGQNIYSVAKAFTVTAAGIAFDRGLLKLEDRVTDILADEIPDGIDPRWHNITPRDAMLHRMGLPSGFLDIDVAPAGAFGEDYLGYMMRYPFAADPCVERCYTDGAFYLMSRVVEKVCGEPIDSLLWREFFLPAGFAEAAWSRCPQGHPMGATGLYISTVDMLKLGELYRRGGVYGGKRILSEKWVSTVLEEGFELRKTGIGSSYGKGGMLGQRLVVFPDKNITVAWEGYRYRETSEILEIIEEFK